MASSAVARFKAPGGNALGRLSRAPTLGGTAAANGAAASAGECRQQPRAAASHPTGPFLSPGPSQRPHSVQRQQLRQQQPRGGQRPGPRGAVNGCAVPCARESAREERLDRHLVQRHRSRCLAQHHGVGRGMLFFPGGGGGGHAASPYRSPTNSPGTRTLQICTRQTHSHRVDT